VNPLKAEEDDQLYYTKIYLNEKLRNDLGLKIDHRSELFTTVIGDTEDIQVIFKGKSRTHLVG
jgi:procollagen-lysine,2-oxoglutarate 5-dioxygenase, invertebrate